MQKEEFLKLYKSYTFLNYHYEISNETEMPVDKRKSIWFKLITINKKRRFSITN